MISALVTQSIPGDACARRPLFVSGGADKSNSGGKLPPDGATLRTSHVQECWGGFGWGLKRGQNVAYELLQRPNSKRLLIS